MRLSLISAIFIIYGSICHSMDSLESLLGEPRLAITDSVLAANRCAGLTVALIAPYFEGNNGPKVVPDDLAKILRYWMPYVNMHIGLDPGGKVNPAHSDFGIIYLRPENVSIMRADMDFCAIWGYWNLQKYGAR